MKKTTWLADKPLPKFKSYAEEVQFWETHDFEEGSPSDWEETTYEPHATRAARTLVYRIRFSEAEMAALQNLASNKGVPASVALRQLVRNASSAQHVESKVRPRRRVKKRA